MKKKQIVSFITFLCVLNLSYGQILTITEKNNGRIDTVKLNSAQIIDINGNLEIGISKDSLIQQLRISHPKYGTQLDLQQRIDALDKALTNQANLLNSLKQQTLNTTDKQTFYLQLNAFYQNLLTSGNEAFRDEANTLFEEWRQQYGPRSNNPNSGIKKEVYILTNFNKSLETTRQELSNSSGKSFMVSMIAYVYSDLGKNRVHIDNFDAISESDIYTVPRWVTTLSASQAAQLQTLQERADAYNKEAPKYFENFKAEILSKLPNLSCLKSFKTDIENFINNGNLTNQIETTLKSDAASLVIEIESLESIINLVSQDISKWTIDTPFEIITQAKNLSISVEGILTNFNEFKNTSAAFTSIKTEVAELIKSFESCYVSISTQVSGLTNALGILKNQQDRFNDNDAIGEEVTKFTLNDLPSTGFIKLKRSGKRDNGDELEVILVLRIPDTNAPTATNTSVNSAPIAYKNETLESHLMTMRLIGLRSQTAVGIIMADAFNEKGFTPIEDKRFLYAPSAALLLKVGSRTSHIYNDFVDFGFGLAISTPDLNVDGTPEFGAGLMLTAIKDILSLGIHYNVTLDTPYWSFGLNLPFNLPGIPINNPK